MKYEEFLDECQNGRVQTVYFFAGEETGFIDEGVELLCRKLVTPEIRDFNFDVFYGSETNAGRVIDSAMKYPEGIKEGQRLKKAAEDMIASRNAPEPSRRTSL